MSTKLRSMIGFLVAPAVPAVVTYIVQLIVVRREAELTGLAVALFGYLSAAVIGIPAHILLQRKGLSGLGMYVFLGFLIGLTCYAVLFVPGVVQNWTADSNGALLMLRNSAGFAVLGALSGLFAGAVFWLISVRRGA